MAMMSLCSFSCFAWNNLDHDVIELDENYINKSSELKEKAVTIFEESYNVYVSDVRLSPTWFAATIMIKPSNEHGDDLELAENVVQFCDIEDPNPDSHGYHSYCEVSLFQNYDFMIKSVVHLRKPSAFGDVTVSDTIYDAGSDNTFTLDLIFPYNPTTITAIDELSTDNTSPVEYFDIQGRKLNGPQPGIVIEKQGNKTTKKIYK